MMFIDGFLALCSAVGAGSATEITAPTYARQAISFTAPRFGISRNSTPWSFGNANGGPMAGRAIYDAPSGGNLLFILPHYAPRPPMGGGPTDAGDVGDIVLNFSGVPYLPALPEGTAFTGLLAAGATVGSAWDVREVIGVVNAMSLANAQSGAPSGASVIPLDFPRFQYVYASPLTVGPGQLAVNRGVLQLQARAQGVE